MAAKRRKRPLLYNCSVAVPGDEANEPTVAGDGDATLGDDAFRVIVCRRYLPRAPAAVCPADRHAGDSRDKRLDEPSLSRE